jgi:hypothetical protein
MSPYHLHSTSYGVFPLRYVAFLWRMLTALGIILGFAVLVLMFIVALELPSLSVDATEVPQHPDYSDTGGFRSVVRTAAY